MWKLKFVAIRNEVLTDLKERLLKKKQKLRNNEYYNMQETFDDLYKMSCDGVKFDNLIQLITQDENQKTSYRHVNISTKEC